MISVGKSSKTDKEVFHTKHWCQSIKTQDSQHYMLIWKGKTQVNNKKTQLMPDNHVNGIYNIILFLLFTYFIHLILILIF